MRECRPKNIFRGEGVWGGYGKYFFANFGGFINFKVHFWVSEYGFGVNKSIPAVKITIHHFVQNLAVMAHNIMGAIYPHLDQNF